MPFQVPLTPTTTPVYQAWVEGQVRRCNRDDIEARVDRFFQDRTRQGRCTFSLELGCTEPGCFRTEVNLRDGRNTLRQASYFGNRDDRDFQSKHTELSLPLFEDTTRLMDEIVVPDSDLVTERVVSEMLNAAITLLYLSDDQGWMTPDRLLALFISAHLITPADNNAQGPLYNLHARFEDGIDLTGLSPTLHVGEGIEDVHFGLYDASPSSKEGGTISPPTIFLTHGVHTDSAAVELPAIPPIFTDMILRLVPNALAAYYPIRER